LYAGLGWAFAYSHRAKRTKLFTDYCRYILGLCYPPSKMRIVRMTHKTKILTLLFSLILPYVALAAYMGFTLRGNTVPIWFLYAAPCYLVVAVSVFILGRKRILASSPAPGIAEQKKQNISGAKAVRRLGYIWLIGPLLYLLDGGLKAHPAWLTFLGFAWAGFLSWASFRQAKKMELKAHQDSEA
jgi:hypothetical protein